MRLRMFLALLGLVFGASTAAAHDVAIDTEAARAVLQAVANPQLTEADARRIAQLQGNRMLIRKQQGYGQPADEARFVRELLAAARGETLPDRGYFNFEQVKRRRDATGRTLDRLEREKPELIRWVSERVGGFAPAGNDLALRGYVIAGGGSTGFAFGGADFYLNIDHFPDDYDAVRTITAHELYHAVQGAALTARGLEESRGFDQDRYAALGSKAERDKHAVEGFLYNLLTEGLAIMVGDPATLTGDAPMSKMERERLQTQQRRMDRLATQLDMSLMALTADQPIAYDRAYALGFYGPDQPLYYLGYAMAQAIARSRGNARIGELSVGTGCEFVREYLTLARADATLPQLGEPTQRLVAAHCPGRA
jgi:hypothetical protein